MTQKKNDGGIEMPEEIEKQLLDLELMKILSEDLNSYPLFDYADFLLRFPHLLKPIKNVKSVANFTIE